MTREVALRYASEVDREAHKGRGESYRLLQCPETLLKKIERALERGEGSEVAFVGAPEDELVLVSADETIAIKEVQISNALLLCQEETAESGRPDTCPGAQWDMLAKLSSVLEGTSCVPRLERLDVLLSGWEWTGQEVQHTPKRQKMGKNRGYSRDDLLNIVQASPQEIDQGLEERRAVLVKDVYHTLAPEYLLALLQSLVLVLQSKDYHYGQGQVIESSELSGALQEQDFGSAIVLQVLQWVSKGTRELCIDPERLTRLVGLELLRNLGSGERRELKEFMTTWKTHVGDSLEKQCRLSLLEGYHLLHPEPAPPTSIHKPGQRGRPSLSKTAVPQAGPSHISPLAHHALPSEPSARFAALFNIRPVWRDLDIRPFLASLAPSLSTSAKSTTTSKSIDLLLAKHARPQSHPNPDGGGSSLWYTNRVLGKDRR